MDFKCKIALLILAGLLMSLFGSYLLAMEPAIIKDVKGQVLELTQAQRNALGQCKTLKQMLGDCGSQTIDFEGTHAPVFKDDVEQLAMLMEDPNQVSTKLAQVPQHKIISLFKLADYLHAPKEVGFALAEKVEHLIIPRIAALEELLDKGQSLNDVRAIEYADLQAQWQPLQKYLSISMSKLLKKPIQRTSLLSGLDIVDLSCAEDTKGSQKLKRLNGIEKLAKPCDIGMLYLNNHNIASVDIASLHKIFPNLYLVSLKNNRIEKIIEKEPIRKKGIKINLKRNPLKSITMEHPEQYDKVLLTIDNPEVKIHFVQNKRDKVLTWFESLAAKSKTVFKYLVPSKLTLVGYASVGALSKCIKNVTEDNFRALLTHNPNQQVLVIGDGIRILSDDEVGEVSLLFSMLGEKLQERIGFMSLKEAVEKFQISMPESKSTFIRWIFEPGKAALKALLICASVEAGAHLLGSISGMYGYRISDKLAHKVYWNPYRIRIKAGNSNHDFPSNYTYNLFGKF